MTTRTGAGVLTVSCLLLTLFGSACTGGSETSAAQQNELPREAPPVLPQQEQIDARHALVAINDAIPIYSGADYRDDLTRRDEAMVRDRYGAGAEVYTLATDDSFPQVYHYYTTYLAQFRALPALDPYPPERKEWRTLEVRLNEAMQDPFIPGKALDVNGKQVMLQIVETEAEPRTVIRYIVTPAPAGLPVVTASNGATPQPIAR
jgi:hypothetical protein